jgi:hypothetical protein
MTTVRGGADTGSDQAGGIEPQDQADANITTFGDALWWAATTVTTVGYGDRFPITATGRAVAVVLMLLGIAVIGVITASVPGLGLTEHEPLGPDRGRRPSDGSQVFHARRLTEGQTTETGRSLLPVGPMALWSRALRPRRTLMPRSVRHLGRTDKRVRCPMPRQGVLLIVWRDVRGLTP